MSILTTKEPFVKHLNIAPGTSFDDNRFELPGLTSYLRVHNLSGINIFLQLGGCLTPYTILANMEFELPVHAVHIEYMSIMHECDSSAYVEVLAGCYCSKGNINW